jgi:predicted amidophosphoribosyltransferase
VASLVDLIAPPRCAICGTAGPLVCEDCLGGLPRLGPTGCLRCGSPSIRNVPACRECRGRRFGFTIARSALAYEGSARTLVHRLKDGGLRGLAAVAADAVVEAVPPPEVDVLTWVPADRWRTIRRGYHPPELLARRLAGRWGVEARPLLRGPLWRRAQRGLSPAARRANVRGAFSAAGAVPGAVAVVDDVHTTGATLSACGTALRRGGARRIVALTLARAVAP